MSRAGYAYSSRDEPGKRVRPVKRRKSNKIIPVIVICGILLLIWQALVGGRGKTEEDGPDRWQCGRSIRRPLQGRRKRNCPWRN